jgi:integrase
MTIDDDGKIIAELRAELAQLREMISSRRTGVLTGKLNATKIANAIKAAVKAGKTQPIGDGGNLWLQITASGTASWLFRWTERGTGRERVMGLGSLNTINLKEAREAALANRKLLVARKDPKKEQDSRILAEQIARGLAKTVRQVDEEFYELQYGHAPLNTQRGARRYRRMINSANGGGGVKLGDMPIEKVDRNIFKEKTEFNKLWLEKRPTARHLRVYGDLLFRYAIDKGYYTSNNPLNWERFKSSLPKKDHITEHHIGVPYKEMPEFIKKLLAYRWGGRLQHFEGSPPMALLVALVAFSGVRPGEARLAQWKEFNFETMTWTVPWQHLKMGRIHKQDRPVPITKQMYEKALKPAMQIAYPKDSSKIGRHGAPVFQRARHTPDVSPEAIVFPDINNKPCDPARIARFMREQIGWKNKDKFCTPHSFRSTLRDWMRAKTNFRDELWQIQADHSLLNREYGPDKLLEERRVMMKEYNESCIKPTAEPKNKVVKLSEKRRQA